MPALSGGGTHSIHPLLVALDDFSRHSSTKPPPAMGPQPESRKHYVVVVRGMKEKIKGELPHQHFEVWDTHDPLNQ